jgi:hypothetical protein
VVRGVRAAGCRQPRPGAGDGLRLGRQRYAAASGMSGRIHRRRRNGWSSPASWCAGAGAKRRWLRLRSSSASRPGRMGANPIRSHSPASAGFSGLSAPFRPHGRHHLARRRGAAHYRAHGRRSGSIGLPSLRRRSTRVTSTPFYRQSVLDGKTAYLAAPTRPRRDRTQARGESAARAAPRGRLETVQEVLIRPWRYLCPASLDA